MLKALHRFHSRREENKNLISNVKSVNPDFALWVAPKLWQLSYKPNQSTKHSVSGTWIICMNPPKYPNILPVLWLNTGACLWPLRSGTCSFHTVSLRVRTTFQFCKSGFRIVVNPSNSSQSVKYWDSYWLITNPKKLRTLSAPFKTKPQIFTWPSFLFNSIAAWIRRHDHH